MGSEGVSLDNMQNLDANIRGEYMTRYARHAHDVLAAVDQDQIRTSVRQYESSFGGRKSIMASVQSLAFFAKSNSDPEAILTAIKREAQDFAKDSPTEQHDGTWLDVRTMNELNANSDLGNITGLLWEETAAAYKDVHGDIPRTAEEKQRLSEAMERAKTTKVI